MFMFTRPDYTLYNYLYKLLCLFVSYGSSSEKRACSMCLVSPTFSTLLLFNHCFCSLTHLISSASPLLLFRMPRLVRRRTLRDRLLSYLNPLDLALDIYTCIESYDWDGVQSTTSTPIGLTLNILLFIARVNCSRTSPSAYNDVLLTQPQKHGWDTGSQLGYSVCNGNLVRHVSWSLGDNLLRGLMGWRAHWGL